MILLAPRFLPSISASPGRFDVTGAITSTLGVGSLVFALLHGAESSWRRHRPHWLPRCSP